MSKKLIRTWFTAVVFLLFSLNAYAQKPFHLQNGDLIFIEECDGGMNSAIKAATSGLDGYNFTHVGIVWQKKNGQNSIIEATPPKVRITPVQTYLHPKNQQCTPRAVVGRLKAQYQPLIPAAITSARQKVGKPYDNAFNIHNDQYYCSELIYQIFKEANHGKEVFPLRAMTFKSKETGEFPVYWVEHFKKMGIPIPEGEQGNNPGDMSRSDLIDIVHFYQ
ncbi:YiiX/YebB-like N1pC/P60 family cysteine hydrolase [Snodgrassella alvi]|uniref:YiiX/YebB-like N1pC/P60 family cysteine hydrolase n=1 Tax=Snodgrassella alvi TaxID=1196083 RepID=UPI003517719B